MNPNASKNQDKLDHRVPWYDPSFSPGPGEKAPIETSPSQGEYYAGIITPLLHGMFTDGGLTLPPHAIGEMNAAGIPWRNWDTELRLFKGRKPWKDLSPKEKFFRKKTWEVVLACRAADAQDALDQGTGFVKLAKLQKEREEELAKWIHRPRGASSITSYCNDCIVYGPPGTYLFFCIRSYGSDRIAI